MSPSPLASPTSPTSPAFPTGTHTVSSSAIKNGTAAAASAASSPRSSASSSAATVGAPSAGAASQAATASVSQIVSVSALKRIAKVDLDAQFSIKSYIGASQKLLETADTADRAGDLETAFVNYLKAAQIIGFISKHNDYATFVSQKHSYYYRYTDLKQRLPGVLERAKANEAELKRKEERESAAQSSSIKNSGSSSAAPERGAGGGGGSGSGGAVNGKSRRDRSDSASSTASQSRRGSVNMGGGSLQERLAALRGAGMATGVVNPKRLSKDTAALSRVVSPPPSVAPDMAPSSSLPPVTPSPPSQPSGSRQPMDAGFGPPSGSTMLGDPSELDDHRPTSAPASGNRASVAPMLDDYDGFRGVDTPSNAVGMHVDAKDVQTAPLPPEAPSVPSSSSLDGHAPSYSDFENAFPPLVDLDRDDNAYSFPSVPSSPPGSSSAAKSTRRQLPPAPLPPTDLTFSRGEVPKPFPYYPLQSPSPPSIGARSSPPPLPPSSSPPVSRPLPSPTVARPLPSPALPSNFAFPISLPKPELPLSSHVGPDNLWSYLGSYSVLLLDVRPRDEYERGRIKARHSVCIEPMLLKENMSSSQLEDRLCVSPAQELTSFVQRAMFDLVVLYDRCSTSLSPPTTSSVSSKAAPPRTAESDERHRRLQVLMNAVYELEYRKPLRRMPMLLIGGFEAWERVIGEEGIVRGVDVDRAGAGAGAVNGPSANGSGSEEARTARPRVPMTEAVRTSRSGSPAVGRRESDMAATDTTTTTTMTTAQMARRASEDPHTTMLKRMHRQASLVPGVTGLSAQLISRSIADNLQHSQVPQSMISTAPANVPPGFYPSVRQGQDPYPKAVSPPAAPRMPAPIYQSPASSANSGSLRIRQHDLHDSQAATGSVPRPSLAGAMPRASFDRSSQLPQHFQDAVSPQPPPLAASPGAGSRPSHVHSNSLQSLSAYSGVSPPPPQQQPWRYQSMTPYDPSASMPHAPGGGSAGMEDVRIGLTGLKNLGNSCYMNSTLQCLSATLPLARYLLLGNFRKDINRFNALGTKGELAEAFAHLVRVMWKEQYSFVSPVTFRDAITRFAEQFRGSNQHDSQEFLAFLLDGLHEDLNRVVHKPPPVKVTPEMEAHLERLPPQVASAKEWKTYRMTNDSFLVDWFQGQFRNKMTCMVCGKTSTTYQAFTYLSLPIPATKRNEVTLASCLDAFVANETLEGSNAWYCPRCETHRRANKRLTLARLPPILLIHLKRFINKGPFTDKIDAVVRFPTEGLDLTNYMPPPLPPGVAAASAGGGAGVDASLVSKETQPPFLYDLYATTHHFGSLSSGHYTATIRNHGEWFYCDDSKVMKSDDSRLRSNSPYMLFYRRQHF